MTSPATSHLLVDPSLSIPRAEISHTTSRSSGPGGQNVNKVETRVTLLFDVDSSPSLTADQKQRLREQLSTRITRDGLLRVSSQKHRTQAANRRAAEERFVELVGQALRRRKARRKTAPSKATRARRLEEKRQRARTKERRRKPALE